MPKGCFLRAAFRQYGDNRLSPDVKAGESRCGGGLAAGRVSSCSFLMLVSVSSGLTALREPESRRAPVRSESRLDLKPSPKYWRAGLVYSTFSSRVVYPLSGAFLSSRGAPR